MRDIGNNDSHLHTTHTVSVRCAHTYKNSYRQPSKNELAPKKCRKSPSIPAHIPGGGASCFKQPWRALFRGTPARKYLGGVRHVSK